MSSPRLNVESCRQPYVFQFFKSSACFSVTLWSPSKNHVNFFYHYCKWDSNVQSSYSVRSTPPYIYIYLIYLPLPFSRQEIVIQIPILVEMKIPRKKWLRWVWKYLPGFTPKKRVTWTASLLKKELLMHIHLYYRYLSTNHERKVL